MMSVASYLILPDSENRFLQVEASVIEQTNEIEVLPVSGRIIKSPYSEEEGLPVVFQWNAMLEPVRIDTLVIMDRDVMYCIGSKMINDWAWVEPTDEWDRGLRRGKIVNVPEEVALLYRVGEYFLYERSKAHRIETQGVNTLNPPGYPLHAIKYYDLLASL